MENQKENEAIKFNPTKAVLSAAVMKSEGLKISGPDDIAGYEMVKAGRKELQDYRIEITKFGKSKRDYFNKAAKEIKRQEDELLEMIVPTEKKLKDELDAFEEAKEKQKRMIL